MNTFDTKHPDRQAILTADFTSDLNTGETLTGTPSVTISCPNESTPVLELNGALALDGTSKKVLIPVQAGTIGKWYLIHVTCATSNASKRVSASAWLPVDYE